MNRVLRNWPLALWGIVLAWAMASATDLHSSGIAGFTSLADGTVVDIAAGGPAERAGMQRGDRVLGVRGPDTQHRGAPGHVPIGETRALVLQRDDERIEVEITFLARTGADRWRAWTPFLLGLWLATIGGYAFHRQPNRLTALLCLAGAGMGLAFLGEPDLPGEPWHGLIMALRSAGVLAGLGAAVQFAFEYTRPTRRASWVYWPLAAYWLVLDWQLLAPGALALSGVSGVLGGVLLMAASATVLVVLTRAWIRGRRVNEPPRISLVFAALTGSVGGLLAAAVIEKLASLQGLVTAMGILAVLAVPWSWVRAGLSMR